MIHHDPRKALGLLTGDQSILSTAREAMAALAAGGVDGVIVGGLAVFLHGHRRTTVDVDVFTTDTQAAAKQLEAAGFVFDPEHREFVKDDVPIQLVTREQVAIASVTTIEIESLPVASLRDLIEMKLRSGLAKVTGAQDVADVIALIRVHEPGGEFSSQLAKELREDYRRLVRAVREEG